MVALPDVRCGRCEDRRESRVTVDPEQAYLTIIEILDSLEEWELQSAVADGVWRNNTRLNLRQAKLTLRNLLVSEEQLVEGRMNEPAFRVALDVDERLGVKEFNERLGVK